MSHPPSPKPSITRLTPKLARLRLRTVGAGGKELASNSHKFSTSSLSSGKKRKEDEKDDDNMKQTPKKKKTEKCSEKTLGIKYFFSTIGYLFSHLYNFLLKD